jgi:restriction system protein
LGKQWAGHAANSDNLTPDAILCKAGGIQSKSETKEGKMPTKEELYDQALTHFANNELEEALDIFTEIVEQYPDYVDGQVGLGHAYERLGRFDEAIEAIQKAIEVDPENPLNYTSLSVCYMRKGMVPEAEDAKAKSQQLLMGK